MTTTTSIPANAKVFIDGVLKGIGAPVNAITEQAMLNWLANEQGGSTLPDFTQDQGNPLGVQTSEAASSGSQGNIQGGINATVGNLLGGSYNSLVSAFRAGNSVTAIDAAVVASPWNGSHYGGFTKYIATAGQTGGVGQLGPLNPGGDPGAALAPAVASVTTPVAGCSAKGNVFGEGGFLGIGSFSFTYCELKALLGALSMAAGATIIVIGMVTLVAGGKGGGLAGKIVAGATPVGRASRAVGRVGGGRSSTPAPTESARAKEDRVWAEMQAEKEAA